MTSDLHDLWREREEIRAALDSGLLADDDPACERFPALDRAIREARPIDPAGLAIQMRLLADEFAAIRHVADERLALRIATALEKLGQARRPGKSDSSVDFAQVASGSAVAPAEQPLRLAIIDSAGPSGPRRLDQLPGGKNAPGARRPSAEPFVCKAAALVWTINIWVVTARAWWMHRRRAPAGRPAAAVAHGDRPARTASCSSFPRSHRLRYSSGRL
jgi:hypothetical protein